MAQGEEASAAEPASLAYDQVRTDAVGVAFATSQRFESVAKIRSQGSLAVIFPGHKIDIPTLQTAGLSTTAILNLRVPLYDPSLRVYQEKQAQLLNLGVVPAQLKSGGHNLPSPATRELFCEASSWYVPSQEWDEMAAGRQGLVGKLKKALKDDDLDVYPIKFQSDTSGQERVTAIVRVGEERADQAIKSSGMDHDMFVRPLFRTQDERDKVDPVVWIKDENLKDARAKVIKVPEAKGLLLARGGSREAGSSTQHHGA